MNKVEKLRNKKEVSINGLAKLCRCSTSVIFDIEKGRIKNPSWNTMCKIADALNVSLDDLRDRKE